MTRYLLLACLTLHLFCYAQLINTPESLLKKGVGAYNNGDYAAAISSFRECEAVSVKMHRKKVLTIARNNLGNAYSRVGKSELALRYYLLAIASSRQENDPLSIAKTLKNIGTLYSEQKDFKRAMQYYEEALMLSNKLNSNDLMADCLNNMGVVYEQQANYKKALNVYLRALKIYTASNDTERISMSLNNLAIVYKCLNDYPKAIVNYQQSLALSAKLGDKFMVAANLNNLGNVYGVAGNNLKSFHLCQLANLKARDIHAQEVIVESYSGMADAMEKLGRFPEALKYRKLYETQKDSFINTNRSGQLAEMQVKYETEKREAKIALLQRDGKIKNLELQKQNLQLDRRNQLLFVFITLLVALFIAGYFWMSRQAIRAKLVTERAIRDTEEQERLRIAMDIHDDLGSGLTKINFLSEIIRSKTKELPEISSSSESIQETAIKMIENMRDLIWALNPDNTTLANLMARLREYTTDYFEDFPVRLAYDFPETLPQTRVTKDSHRALFMVVKETLNNILKYAHAENVIFKVSLTDETLAIVIKDDGKGFEIDVTKGNGLRNMKTRIEAIGGTFKIVSKKSQGTQIEVFVALNKIVRPAAIG